MIDGVLALTRTNVEGVLVFISSMLLFCGSIYVLLAAVYGGRMGYLISATAFFAFMIILSAIWAFGAPGTPKYLGPKGALPGWIALAEGPALRSPTYPVIEEYPGGDWKPPSTGEQAEVEPVTLAFQDFLAEEANADLRESKIEGEVAPADFEVTNVRFTTVDERQLAAATAFSSLGGPEVVVFGYKDPGNEGLPSFAFLIASLIGFGAHLPFLDRAERKRKQILTGGEQPPFLGPA